jgi:hypothetical protein
MGELNPFLNAVAFEIMTHRAGGRLDSLAKNRREETLYTYN